MRGRLILSYLTLQHVRTALMVLACLFLILLLSQVSNFAQYQGRIDAWQFSDTLLISILRAPVLLQAILPHTILVSAAVSVALACRRLEVAVLMQNGYSPTRLILPTILSAAAIGVVFMLVLNPMFTVAHNTSERAIRDLGGGGRAALRNQAREVYISNEDGAIYALIDDVSGRPDLLTGVTFYRVDESHVLQRTLEARRAVAVATDRWRLEDVSELYRAPDATDLPAAEGYEITFDTAALDRRFDSQDMIGFYDLPARVALSRIVGAQDYEPRYRLAWLIALPGLLAGVAYLSGAIVIRPLQRGGWKNDAVLVLAAAFTVYTLSTVLEALAIRGVIGAVPAVATVPVLSAGSGALLIWLKRGGNRILRNPFGKRGQAMQRV